MLGLAQPKPYHRKIKTAKHSALPQATNLLLDAMPTHQTGLFYQKLPNRIYVDKSKKNDYAAGAKQMKDKTRITLMVGTVADGTKVPLSIVGKPKP